MMKRFLLFAVMGLLLLGCKKSKNSPEINPENGQVAFVFGNNANFTRYLDKNTITFQANVTYKESSEKFTFKSNVNKWTAESLAKDWLTVTPTSGEQGEYTLNINFKRNEGNQREGKIMVRSGNSMFAIIIKQNPLGAFEFGNNALFDKYVLNETGSGKQTLTFQANVTYEAGSEDFVFKSNLKNWTAENLTNDWLTVSPTSGNKGEYATLSINFTKNGGARREGKIQVSSGDSIFMIIIQQSEPFVFRVGEFSISDEQKVHVSPGNLQYQASSGTWRFAERQFDRCGNGVANGTTQSGIKGASTVFWEDAGVTKPCDNSLISSNYGGWIDAFVWGSGNKPTHTDVNTDWSDWGDNAIQEGDITPPAKTWRTLTKTEWEHLLEGRRSNGEISYSFVLLRYGSNATDTVTGIIIYPDHFSFAMAGVDPIPVDPDADLTEINLSVWSSLEKVGAVFLPWAEPYNDCNYWSATQSVAWTTKAHYVHFHMESHSISLWTNSSYERYPVRLVQDIE